MEKQEIELVLEKIWDLHDKFSDTIHSISRTHFLNSSKPFLINNKPLFNNNNINNHNNNNNGFVFVKDFDKEFSDISEAKSLNSIRSALENLEDHLQFLHTVQVQQRAERDAALARLEQSRIILALRLAEHHGKNYRVIDEAINFVGDVRDASCFSGSAEHCTQPRLGSSNLLVKVLLTGFDTAKKTLSLDKMGGLLGNAAVFTVSMLALLHLHRVRFKDNELLGVGMKERSTGKKSTRANGSPWSDNHLDVRLARG